MAILDRFSLKGRVALVTGGGRGLGFEIARAFAEAGARVVVNGRNAAALADAVDAIDAAVDQVGDEAGGPAGGPSGAPATGGAEAAAFDIVDRAAASAALAGVRARHGRLDILVNNVGVRDRRPLADFDDAAIARQLDTNLVAAVALARDAAEIMKAQGHGRLIAVTSIAGSVALPGDGVYPVAKAGLTGLVRALAVAYGPYGVTSNAIAPGMFATEANADLANDPAMIEFASARVPVGRWGRPDEIAGAALFLAGDASSFVNGHVLTVDGGMTVKM